MCMIKDNDNVNTLFIAYRNENVYTIEFDAITSQNLVCFSAIDEASWLWHRRLGHASIDLLLRLSRNELVKGLPKTKFLKDNICDTCQLAK